MLESDSLGAEFGDVRLGVTTRGVRLVVAAGSWESGGVCRFSADTDDFKTLVTVIGPRGRVRRADRMSDQLQGSPVALPHGRIALLTMDFNGSPDGVGEGTLALRVGLPNDVVDAPRQIIAEHVASFTGVIAADARGDLAIGWTGLDGTATYSGVAVRRIGRPRLRIRLPRAPLHANQAPSIAWGSNEDLLIAYPRRDRRDRATMFARYLTPRGVLEPAQALGPSDNAPHIATAVGGHGQAVVVWDSQLTRPYRVYASVRASDSPRFADPEPLERSRYDVEDPGSYARSGLAAVILAGHPTVFFSAPRDNGKTTEPQYVAQADAAGRFRRRRQLLGGTSELDGVEPSNDGTVSALYGSEYARRNVHLITLGPNGRPTRPPALVGRYGYSGFAALARNPRTGQLVAAWAYDTHGRNGQTAVTPDKLVTATRT